MPADPDSAPLSIAALHILLSLAGGDLHGYGILLEIARISGKKYKVGPGTLYDNLKSLLARGLVTARSEDKVDEREARRLYHLAENGEAALTNELARLDAIVRTGRDRLATLERPRRAT